MQQWKSTVMGVIYAIIIYAVAGFIATVLSTLSSISSAANAFGGADMPDTGLGVASWIFLIIELGGFVWFFMNLSKFIGLQQNDADRNAVTMVRNAYIVQVAGVILAFLPAIGWLLALVCSLVSLIMLIIGFGNMAKSEFMNAVGKSGASLLKIGVIISLIGVVLALIPLIGDFLALICSLVYIVLLFMGWTKVSNGYPTEA